MDLKTRFHESCENLCSKLSTLQLSLESKQFSEREDVNVDLSNSLESVVTALKVLKEFILEMNNLSTNETVESKQQKELEKQLVDVKVLLANALSRKEELCSSLSSLKKIQSQDGKTSCSTVGSWQVFGSFKGMNTENQLKGDFNRRAKLAEDRAVAACEATKRTRAHLEELQTALRKEQERTNELVKSLDELEESW
ncbi:hypothetical protein GpartN1_g2915.t1 [Galdieria partita]|uniref:Uncharacterized protein n=1 Tax=Galdieria partita TaxID=83374 RepID=A0A9C7UPP3_9RHOD|nr:hypothetical protein GpartN1_g2915.t1 [Galdieria partita]